MTGISRLRCREAVGVDPARLLVLYEELGESEAEEVIATAMEDLAFHLSMIDEASRIGHRSHLRLALPEVATLAESVGLTALARVAEDLCDCVTQGDPVAEAAIMARLNRIAERALTEVWDLDAPPA